MATLPEAGYPMAEISDDGGVLITKPAASGGLVSVGTVAEQMLYEIGDPQAYLLPDVACDFSGVTLTQVAPDRVRVAGARGHGAPEGYKVSATCGDGFRAGQIWTLYGRDAGTKAEHFARAVFARSSAVLRQAGLEDFTETSYEVIGAETHFGSARRVGAVREVDLKIAARHPSPKGIGVLLKEMVGMALTAPPGLTGFAGARAKPSPVVRLFSMVVPKDRVQIRVDCEGQVEACDDSVDRSFDPAALSPQQVPQADFASGRDLVGVPLEVLAWGRSGDKGNKANIGIIARHPEYLPFIAAQLTAQRVGELFEHFLAPDQGEPVERFYLPGTNALNFLLHEVLGGGGVASLRADPQGKGYAQVLLAETVQVPVELAEQAGWSEH